MIAQKSQTAQYLVAKYVPDIRRMEPRNIGVFVWMPGAISARFLQPDDAVPFVNEPETYNRWVRFWNEKIAQDELVCHGKKTPKDSAEYLDALIDTQNGNYRIYVGGETLNAVEAGEVEDVSEYLFDELVATKSPRVVKKAKDSAHRLQSACSKIFEDLGIKGHVGLQTNRQLACQIRNVWEEFKFHHAWGEYPIHTVIQRVALNDLQAVHHTAYMFGVMPEAKILDINPQTQRVAVVDTSDPLLTADLAAKRHGLLEHLSTAVVDVAKLDKATEQVGSLLGI